MSEGAWDSRASKDTRKWCCGNGRDAFSELTEMGRRQGPLWLCGENLCSAAVRGKI